MARDDNRFFASLRRLIRPRTGATASQTPIYREPAFDEEVMAQILCKKRQIETSVADTSTARRFMGRVIGQWQALGESDPHWSNDTQDRFRKENLSDAVLTDFYREGDGVLSFIEAFESRSEVDVGQGICLELGCGVGKHTHALAKRFSHLIGLDVSGAGLAVCTHQMEVFGLTNVTTMLLTTPDDIAKCGTIDLFVCLSVLQHNPPPIQKQLLDTALTNLRPGGFCLFQTPDTFGDYTFSAQQFLASDAAAVDIHCFPKTDVLKVLEANGMRLLDFAPDMTLGRFGSYTYFAKKR